MPAAGRLVVLGTMLVVVVIAAILLIATGVVRSRLFNLSRFTVRDTNGEEVALKNTGNLVLVFLSPDCPVSRQYCHELNALARYSQVQFAGIVPGGETLSMKVFREKHQLVFELFSDPDRKLSNMLGVTSTPHAVVLTGRDIVYSGAIDDSFITLYSRKAVEQRYLQDALLAVMQKGTVKTRKTNVVGCLLGEHPTTNETQKKEAAHAGSSH